MVVFALQHFVPLCVGCIIQRFYEVQLFLFGFSKQRPASVKTQWISFLHAKESSVATGRRAVSPRPWGGGLYIQSCSQYTVSEICWMFAPRFLRSGHKQASISIKFIYPPLPHLPLQKKRLLRALLALSNFSYLPLLAVTFARCPSGAERRHAALIVNAVWMRCLGKGPCISRAP